MKLTGILKSPNEILGVDKTVALINSFDSGTATEVSYPAKFGVYIGQRVNLKKDNDPFSNYDYAFWTDGGIVGFLRKEWLKDIQEEINWQEVQFEAKIEIECGEYKTKAYFHSYDSVRDEVRIFIDGRTSWTGTHTTSYPAQFCRLVK